MDHQRAAGGLGVLACLLTAAAVVAPYALVPAGRSADVSAYYSVGAVTPLGVGLLGLVGAIIFAAGREGRSDPDLVAGIVLVLGLFSLVAGVEWALAFRPDLVASTASLELMSAHRWSVPAGAALETAAAVWFAAARGLVPAPAGVSGAAGNR